MAANTPSGSESVFRPGEAVVKTPPAKPKGAISRAWPVWVFLLFVGALLARDLLYAGGNALGLFAATDLEKISVCMERYARVMTVLRLEQIGIARAACAKPYVKPVADNSVIVGQAIFDEKTPGKQLALTIKNVSTGWVITGFTMPFEFYKDAFSSNGGEKAPTPVFKNKFEDMWIEPGASINVNLNLDAPYDFQKAMANGSTPPFDWKIEEIQGIPFQVETSPSWFPVPGGF